MHISDQKLHDQFLASERPHILMITNHGIHQWDVIPGLPDTGGQNVFVNQFTSTLADFGFRISIVNRGGYPHPVTGEMRHGIDYRDAHERIIYIEDGAHAFVRKEDMLAQTPQLTLFLQDVLAQDETAVDLIISHYWDGAKIGSLLNATFETPVKHIWVPHSLGAVKKRNVAPSRYEDLRIDERIATEKLLIPTLHGVAATSSLIRESLREDYGCEEPMFLPPCVETDRYHAHTLPDEHPIWRFLAEHAEMDPADVRVRRIVTEISRTDTTKRKNVLIEAFAQVHAQFPDTLLAISIDDRQEELAAELRTLLENLGIRESTAVLGYVWDELPDIYAATAVYCSPSVMEGFGMSVQEAAATKVPVISSNLIPFVSEYLLGDAVEEITYAGMDTLPLQIGEGAIVVEADNVPGFAEALKRLLGDGQMRRTMGERAYDITVPYFTWQDMTRRFLDEAGVAIPREGEAEQHAEQA